MFEQSSTFLIMMCATLVFPTFEFAEGRKFNYKLLKAGAGGLALGVLSGGDMNMASMSWDEIDHVVEEMATKIQHLELLLQEVEENLDPVTKIQLALWPVISLMVFMILGIIYYLFKKMNKVDFLSNIQKLSKLPEYLNKLRTNHLNQNANHGIFPNYGNAPPLPPQNPNYNTQVMGGVQNPLNG